MKKLYFTCLVLIISTLTINAQNDIYATVSNSIIKGDAKTLSSYFGTNVDLTILNKEEVYSKSQAEQILLEFFNKNKPTDFKIMHKGVSKDGAKYAIGNLKTGNGTTFRTYFFIKSQMGSDIVHELRFERE